MTSVAPPTYYFSGIYYNSSFYTSSSSSSSGGLTQAKANTLYLRKTVPDSASSLESFTAGITTNSLDTNIPTASFSMLASVTGNNIGIGIATGAPAYTGVKTIQIGETTVTSVHAGGIDCTGSTINNAVTPAGGALSLGSSQTGGILNLGTNASRTGVINIGTGATASTGQINIGTGGLSTIVIGNNLSNGAQITIGNAGAGSKVVIPCTITTQVIDYSGTMNIGQTTSNLTIGGVSATSITNIIGNTINITGNSVVASNGIITPIIDVTSPAGTISIGNTLTTGTLYIGQGINASGNIRIGTSTTTTTYGGSINASAIKTNTIDLLSGGTLSLGATSTAVNILGPTTALSLDSIAVNGNLTICGTQTSGPLYIGCNSSGTGTRTTAGTINIGLISSLALPINIGGNTSLTLIGGNLGVTGVLSATGNILTPFIDAISSTVNLGIATLQTSGILNIGTGSRTTAGQINIGTIPSIAVPITIGGNSSITSIGGTLGVNGLLTATGGLTIGGSNNITLGNIIATPSLKTQLGYSVSSAGVVGTAINTGSIYVYSPAVGTSSFNLSNGVYLASIHGYLNFTGTITSTNADFQFGMQYNTTTTPSSGTNVGISGANIDYNVTYAPESLSTVHYTATFTFTVTTTAYYYAYAYVGIGGLTGTGSPTLQPCVQMITLVRIA